MQTANNCSVDHQRAVADDAYYIEHTVDRVAVPLSYVREHVDPDWPDIAGSVTLIRSGCAGCGCLMIAAVHSEHHVARAATARGIAAGLRHVVKEHDPAQPERYVELADTYDAIADQHEAFVFSARN